MYLPGDNVKYANTAYIQSRGLVESFRIGTIVDVSGNKVVVLDTAEDGEPSVDFQLPEHGDEVAKVTFKTISKSAISPADSRVFAAATHEEMVLVTEAYEEFKSIMEM